MGWQSMRGRPSQALGGRQRAIRVLFRAIRFDDLLDLVRGALQQVLGRPDLGLGIGELMLEVALRLVVVGHVVTFLVSGRC
jgi:hypothetical protein